MKENQKKSFMIEIDILNVDVIWIQENVNIRWWWWWLECRFNSSQNQWFKLGGVGQFRFFYISFQQQENIFWTNKQKTIRRTFFSWNSFIQFFFWCCCCLWKFFIHRQRRSQDTIFFLCVCVFVQYRSILLLLQFLATNQPTTTTKNIGTTPEIFYFFLPKKMMPHNEWMKEWWWWWPPHAVGHIITVRPSSGSD